MSFLLNGTFLLQYFLWSVPYILLKKTDQNSNDQLKMLIWNITEIDIYNLNKFNGA